MSRLRPECGTASDNSRTLPRDTTLFLIRDAVAHRRSLIYGRLRDGKGGTCAMGAFWADNPGVTVPSDLVDEVAAVNDSVPKNALPSVRWRKVNEWLRFKIASLATGKRL